MKRLASTLLSAALCATVAVSVSQRAFADDEPPTQEEQLNAMLAPLGYVSIHHVEFDNFGWWTNWMDHNSPGYAGYVSAASVANAKCAIVYKLQGNEWWHRMLFFYDGSESSVWLAEESGTFDESTPGTTYTLSTGALHTGNWFDQSLYYVTICDLPDLVNHQRISGMFWQLDGTMDMYVIAPSDAIVYGVKPVNLPASLQVGETAPISGVVYDTVRGTLFPDVPVTCSGDVFLDVQGGTIRGRAASGWGYGTVKFSATAPDGSAVSCEAKINTPLPNMRLYREYASWEFTDAICQNWWLSVDWRLYGEIAAALNDEMTLVKIEFHNPSEGAIGYSNQFVFNKTEENDGDWYRTSLSGWESIAPGQSVTEWLALADPYTRIDSLICNFATGLQVDRITVYHKDEGTMLIFR